MPLYEVFSDRLIQHRPDRFSDLHLYERADLQRLLRDDIAVIDPNLLVIWEEFGNWEDAKRRIDLLAIDREARLVVIELKRTELGGHMELQAIRYAAMVSTMAFSDVLAAFSVHREKHPNRDGEEPEDELRAWLQQTGVEEEPEISSVASAGVITNSANRPPHTGSWYAWLNGRGTAHTETLYQPVTIPAGVSSATLAFWLHQHRGGIHHRCG
jgi:hypothetical protein